jgi:hypothetical protein
MLCVVFTIYLIKAGGYKGTTLTRVLLYGIVRIIVATVGARIVGYHYVRSLEKKLEINTEIIIKTNLKETTDSLFYLYQDIEGLFKQHN